MAAPGKVTLQPLPMLCAQDVCSEGVLPFLCVPVAVWGLAMGAVGCFPHTHWHLCVAGLDGQCVASVVWGIAGCQGDIVSLDVWAYLVRGTHF